METVLYAYSILAAEAEAEMGEEEDTERSDAPYHSAWSAYSAGVADLAMWTMYVFLLSLVAAVTFAAASNRGLQCSPPRGGWLVRAGLRAAGRSCHVCAGSRAAGLYVASNRAEVASPPAAGELRRHHGRVRKPTTMRGYALPAGCTAAMREDASSRRGSMTSHRPTRHGAEAAARRPSPPPSWPPVRLLPHASCPSVRHA